MGVLPTKCQRWLNFSCKSLLIAGLIVDGSIIQKGNEKNSCNGVNRKKLLVNCILVIKLLSLSDKYNQKILQIHC